MKKEISPESTIEFQTYTHTHREKFIDACNKNRKPKKKRKKNCIINLSLCKKISGMFFIQQFFFILHHHLHFGIHCLLSGNFLRKPSFSTLFIFGNIFSFKNSFFFFHHHWIYLFFFFFSFFCLFVCCLVKQPQRKIRAMNF